ncbi:HAD family hydrolase [Anaerosporobacter sp.]
MFQDIEWIFFDVGSTLLDEHKAYEHRIQDMMVGNEDITYQQIYDKMIELYKENKKGDIEVAKQLGVTLTKWHSEDEQLYPETLSCLEYLSKKYKIGIIANQPLGTKERLKKHRILEYIDLVIASAEEGVSKPDLRIFNIALERANCLPEHSIMVGDRIDNDLVPAKTLGMYTIWIQQGFGGYWTIRDKREEADLVVKNLSEICEYL